MKNKQKIKIGISLLITLLFLVGSFPLVGATGVKTVETNAGDNPTPLVDPVKPMPSMAEFEILKLPTNPSPEQQPCPVEVQGLISPVINDASMMPGGTYPITVSVFNFPGCGEATVKLFVDIYQKTEGISVNMYETSFEDNFDIYNNWVQIDGDCGLVGGYYDSWSWSDARATDGDHSMKTTMYDIYKGNQDDYLQCTKVFDVSEQDAVEVSFDVWVEGQYAEIWSYGGNDMFTPYDYVSFEFSDDGGITWVNPDWGFNGLANTNDMMLFAGSAEDSFTIEGQYNPGGGYYFFDTTLPLYDYDPWESYIYKASETTDGFWHVWWKCPVALLDSMGYDTTNLMFRFDWHTDPEHQYEGGYIDNFQVNSIESMETKVFQSHSQGPIVLQECENKYTFPMEWTVPSGDKDNAYDIRVWMEVLDENHYSLNDWPDYLDVYAIVSDWFDIEMVAGSLLITTSFGEDPIIPGTGIITEGSDAHIQADVHVDGTLPVPSLSMTASAYKKSWKTLYSENFEAPLAWQTYGSAHRTALQSWSPTHALAFNYEDIQRYHMNEFSYAISPYSVDFKDQIQVKVDFYCRYLTEASYDYFRMCFLDANANYVLGWNTRSGYQPDWIGPLQPECSYVSTDLLYYYNYWHDVRGFFTDNDGNQIWEVPFGWYFVSDSTTNYNSLALSQGDYTSGVWIDDVVVKAESLDATPIWSETQTFTGPFEPCETIHAQFEWEDVPYSNYRIIVDATSQGACGNLESQPLAAQILSVSNLEMADNKEIEFIDYTGTSNGEWGISSSDYDNYLATNPDTELYVEDSMAIAMLCPDGDECIDISDLFTTGGGGGTVNFINEDFSAGVPPTGWTDLYGTWTSDPAASAGGVAPELELYWLDALDGDTITTMVVDTSAATSLTLTFRNYYDMYAAGTTNAFVEIYYSGTWHDITPWSNPINADLPATQYTIPVNAAIGTNTQVRFRWTGDYFDLNWWDIDDVKLSGTVTGGGPTPPANLWMYFDAWWDLDFGYDFVYVQVANCPADQYSDWVTVDTFTGESRWIFGADDDGWIPGYAVDLAFTGMSTQIAVRFLFTSDESGNFRGMKIDDLSIPDINFGPDPMDDMDNWCASVYSMGNFWTYNPINGQWCITWPAAPIENAMIWSTEIMDAYEAYLTFQWMKNIVSSYPEVRVQVSADGGVSWYTICIFDTNKPVTADPATGTYSYDLTPFAGKAVLIRVIVDNTNYAGYSGAGSFCIWNLAITGKKDNTPPVTTMTMSGTMKDSGWYTTSVKFVITATDSGSGMGEIHYIVDGKETVVAGAKAEFTVSGNGQHNVQYWGVDKIGNVEARHTVPTFRIDAGAAPTVSITAPVNGIYLFGNKVLSFGSKPIMIGAFTCEATANDVDSGVYRVTFYLDGNVVGEDTTAPFSCYIAQKHMGAGTLKVVAEDFAQNKAEASLDITYFKLL